MYVWICETVHKTRMLKWLDKTAIVCDNIARRMDEMENGAGKIVSLLPPCRIGHTQEVKRLIESGVNINHMNVFNQTGLMLAVSGGHNNVVELLLDQPDVDLTVQSFNDNTVLHEAVEANNVDALHMLLDHPRHGNVEARNKDGKTAGDIAR